MSDKHPDAIVFEIAPDDGEMVESWHIPWQDGPEKEVGVNGIQAEAVLEQVAEYLRSFLPPVENGEPLDYGQQCTENAVLAVQSALYHLNQRTADRKSRGVEGTSAA